MKCVDASVYVSPAGATLGIFLVVATVLVPLPQCVKLCRAQCSAGVSPLMLGMMGVYNVFNLCDLIFTKWRSVQQCAHTAHCILDLLDAAQQGISAVWNLSLMVQAVSYTPHNAPKFKLLTSALLFGSLGSVLASCLVSSRSICSDVSLDFAQGFSYAASCIVLVAFAPQLVSTWRLKSAGSLSFLFMSAQAIGNLAVTANYAFVQKDPWTGWGPVLMAAFMQFAIVALAAYYHCKDKALGGSEMEEEAEGKDVEEPMLNDMPPISQSDFDEQEPT